MSAKEKALAVLQDEWDTCVECSLHETRTNVCQSVGYVDADIMIVQSYPSKEDDLAGSTLCGEEGSIIVEMMESYNVNEVYATHAILCAPYVRVQATEEEESYLSVVKPNIKVLRKCLPKLHEQIYLVDPLAIVAVGKPALDALGCRDYTGKRPRKVTDAYGKILYADIPGKFLETIRYPVVAVGSTEVLLNNAYPGKGPLAQAKEAVDALIDYVEWIKEYT